MPMRAKVIEKRGYSKSIKGDELSLKISSYPVTAAYLAERLAKNGDTICELCCGVGISLMEFSHHFDSVIGVDNDLQVIESARYNLQDAGVKNGELIEGDIEDPNILSTIRADIVAYDIPYWSEHGGMVEYKNPDLKKIVDAIRATVSHQIVIYAPPHVSYGSIAELFDDFEYQQVWVNDKHDRNFVYLGSLIDRQGITKVSFTGL